MLQVFKNILIVIKLKQYCIMKVFRVWHRVRQDKMVTTTVIFGGLAHFILYILYRVICSSSKTSLSCLECSNLIELDQDAAISSSRCYCYPVYWIQWLNLTIQCWIPKLDGEPCLLRWFRCFLGADVWSVFKCSKHLHLACTLSLSPYFFPSSLYLFCMVLLNSPFYIH